MTDWKGLVVRLAVDDPRARQAHSDAPEWCIFCDGVEDVDESIAHMAGCAWIDARRALDLPLGVGHTAKSPVIDI